MTITLNIHDSWATVPVALSHILATLAALEHPREPDDGDDLAEVLDGIDAPEPQPAAQQALAKPSPVAAPATPPSKPSFTVLDEDKEKTVMQLEGPARLLPRGAALRAWTMTFKAPVDGKPLRITLEIRYYLAAAWAAAPESTDPEWRALDLLPGRVVAIRLTSVPPKPTKCPPCPDANGRELEVLTLGAQKSPTTSRPWHRGASP
jgi:hypothetical protein